MASAEQDLLDAVSADDAARVTELVAADPFLATVRDRDGVSAIMRSRYRFDRATTDALLAVDPELDVFEATALGYIDRLRERLDEDPARAAGLLRGRVHGPPLRRVLRQGRSRPGVADVRGRRRRRVTERPAASSRSTRPRPACITRSAGC